MRFIAILLLLLTVTSGCHLISKPQSNSALSNRNSTITNPLPRQVGLVNDFANVLDQNTKDQLEQTLTDFKNKTNIDFAVVTIETTGDQTPYDYSLALGNGWGVGSKNPDKAGMLMLVVINDRKWHIQISRAIQRVLSNDDVAKLGALMTVPFQQKKYGEGIRICVDAFIKTLSERRTPASVDFEPTR
jgi:uncharacterized protein